MPVNTNLTIRLRFAAFFLCLFANPASADSKDDTWLLFGATLIDGSSDQVIENSRIVIVGDRFACVSGPDGCEDFGNVTAVDVSDRWITPGLIDTHAHLDPERDPERTRLAQDLRFALGVTSVRDAGTGQFEALVKARDRASSALLPVPRISISARPLDQYARQFDVEPGSELVDYLINSGADAIKVKDHLASELFGEEIRAAEAAGVPVWVHLLQTMGPPPVAMTEPALRDGLSGIAHLSWIAPFCLQEGVVVSEEPTDRDIHEWSKSYWQSTDSACLDELIVGVVEAGAWLEPTLVTVRYWWRRSLEPPSHLSFLRTRPPGIKELLMGSNALGTHKPPTFPGPYAEMLRFVGRFHEAGGMVVAGTDEVRPGLDIHAEIEFLQNAGLSPMESLKAATSNAAIALANPDIGTVQSGKLADAVIYSADPLASPTNTLRVESVIKGGEIYNSAALLEPFKARYHEAVVSAWVNRTIRLLPLGLAGLGLLVVSILLLRRLRR